MDVLGARAVERAPSTSRVGQIVVGLRNYDRCGPTLLELKRDPTT